MSAFQRGENAAVAREMARSGLPSVMRWGRQSDLRSPRRSCNAIEVGRQAPMLHINDVTLRLGPRILFDKASAALPDNARIGFVGRNGAGKTTLFRMIAGELAPESGTISYPRQMRKR